ncbi:N-acetylmuramoyl-L-alanine amidase [Clostridium intestinale]|uniref:N-acetylmuramoyl-L-alanine amidase n=1 Tax=Clostridium intestinale TaxID=36845 RepID=UPI002DD6978A|nr:N-acetylmuramoyl-L-alanine amidase [Clostridium intestinale]WRY52980.1 N-acetylmuramoyl-L-alanine amidase [Clostridium intestinale]
MKYAIAVGHTLSGADYGAVGYLIESICTRQIGELVQNYLLAQGHTVVFCRIDNASSVGQSLSYRVNKANSENVDLYVEIHLNAGGGTGSEVWIYRTGSTAEQYARNVVNSLAELNYPNRGVKTSQNLYVLRNTVAPAILVECCFVDNRADADRYNADSIARAIVKGLTGTNSNTSPEPSIPVTPPSTPNGGNSNIRTLQQEINTQFNSGLVVDGIAGPKTLAAAPMVSQGARGNITKWIQQNLGIAADGIFGPQTRQSVISFQRSNGLSTDGIVGPNTWRKLLGL